ncbi:MAG: tetratricopeptide (TPR) repeat protein [Planctomycetota bacterium]|jgi:tetratricopeptide (TPR) repeat protein
MLSSLLVFCLLLLPGSPSAPAPSSPQDLQGLESALEARPDDADLLAAAVDAAEAEGAQDKALWYALLALEASDGQSKSKSRDADLTKYLTGLGLAKSLPSVVQGEHAETLFRLAKTAESKKLYANAADFLGNCAGTQYAERAQERLTKLFSKSKAVDALLASGIDVPMATRNTLSPKALARLDAKHTEWEKAEEFKGKYYTVTTNMGHEIGGDILFALEQMNAFYRQVFRYKMRGQTMRRCAVQVYKSREEFEKHEPSMRGRPTTKGFFRPGQNIVVTYDQRTDGGTLESLWGTLYHEASHQFTDAVWPEPIPTWLNEGTACYFEGAELRAGGRVAKNLVPPSRLRNLVALLSQRAVTVKEVITYFQSGSYPGNYYPVGWGLVYFCHNFEDAQSERPYLPIYREFMESYKGAGKHDIYERFVEYFVERANVEGIDTFEAFVAQFTTWIRELNKQHFGGPKQAPALLARANTQRTNGKLEAATETYRKVLDKLPGSIPAAIGLAQCLAGLDQKDGALYSWRQVVGLAHKKLSGDPESEQATAWIELAKAGISAVDKRLGETLSSAGIELEQNASLAADSWIGAGSPRAALHLLSSARRLLGRPSSLDDLAASIRDTSGVNISRWRQLPITKDLEDWRAAPGWKVDQQSLVCDIGGFTRCLWREDLEVPYRLSVEVNVSDASKGAFVGVTLGTGVNGGGTSFVLSTGSGQAGTLTGSGASPTVSLRAAMKLVDGRGLLEVVATAKGTRLLLDGKELMKESTLGGAKAANGLVGLIAQGRGVRFETVRLRN